MYFLFMLQGSRNFSRFVKVTGAEIKSRQRAPSKIFAYRKRGVEEATTTSRLSETVYKPP